jgi:hypothetical protein
MDMNDSDYVMGSQTLLEIEMQENAVLNKPETDVIEGSQDFIKETPKGTSQHQKSLSDRFKIATQKQNDKKKFSKTRSESSIEDPVRKNRKSIGDSSMTLSRMIRNEIENVDFNAW